MAAWLCCRLGFSACVHDPLSGLADHEQCLCAARLVPLAVSELTHNLLTAHSVWFGMAQQSEVQVDGVAKTHPSKQHMMVLSQSNRKWRPLPNLSRELSTIV